MLLLVVPTIMAFSPPAIFPPSLPSPAFSEGNSSSLAGRLPSVCLMMPTANRPELVLRALEMMGRQEYPSSLLKEVVVVDDSPSDLRVLYAALATRNTAGTRMNDSSSRSHCCAFLTLRARDLRRDLVGIRPRPIRVERGQLTASAAASAASAAAVGAVLGHDIHEFAVALRPQRFAQEVGALGDRRRALSREEGAACEEQRGVRT